MEKNKWLITYYGIKMVKDMYNFNKLSNERQIEIIKTEAVECLKRGDKKNCDMLLDLIDPLWREVELVESK